MSESVETAAREVLSEPVVIVNPDGLHARPAAVLAECAKKFSSSVAIEHGDRRVNAKSVVALMGMGLKAHDSVRIVANGEDARDAVDRLAPLIAGGLGEGAGGAPKKTQGAPARPQTASTDDTRMTGAPASPGVATGRVFQLRQTTVEVAEAGKGVEAEKKSLRDAIALARREVEEIEKTLRLRAEPGKAAIFSAHGELLDDPELRDAATASIEAGKSAAYAWKEAFTRQADALARMNNELLAARANDIRDVGGRVLSHLAGIARKGIEAPDGSILIADDLTPSDAAGLDGRHVLGFCTTGGSATSHASILARAAGIPAIAAMDDRALQIPDGTVVILDGNAGILRLDPPRSEIEAVEAQLLETSRVRAEELAEAAKPAVTTDGRRIEVVGNIGGAAEAEEIPALGGEGVGLLRSEFLFLQRAEAPTEEEQAAVYVSIARTLGPDRVMVVRTLDVGGDKPLAYLPLPREANPFLGVRGIRLNMLGERGEALFTSQVRAILQAAPFTRLHIMFPMVSDLGELRNAKNIVLREKKNLGVEEEVRVGIMIEVPSAATMADLLAAEADFFSIGTNDLTQYTLAVDRGHPKLARMADALHPAVLRLIAHTVRGAKKYGRWVGVCGGIAGDAEAVPILIGLGVDELSVSIASIPAIKAAVRRCDAGECRRIAQAALDLPGAAEVRRLLADANASDPV